MPEHLFKNLLERTKQLNCQNLPVIMCAHTSVSGCDFKGHDPEGETTIGGIDTMDIDEFGDGYDYLALGHIHRRRLLAEVKDSQDTRGLHSPFPSMKITLTVSL